MGEIIGGVIFLAFVVGAVLYSRSKSDDREGGDGPGSGGKDRPPRSDRRGPLDK